jgi:hypothetical protein
MKLMLNTFFCVDIIFKLNSKQRLKHTFFHLTVSLQIFIKQNARIISHTFFSWFSINLRGPFEFFFHSNLEGQSAAGGRRIKTKKLSTHTLKLKQEKMQHKQVYAIAKVLKKSTM